MNLVEIFGLLGALIGAFLGVLCALFFARWLLSTPPDSETNGNAVGDGAPRHRLSRFLVALFRRPAR